MQQEVLVDVRDQGWLGRGDVAVIEISTECSVNHGEVLAERQTAPNGRGGDRVRMPGRPYRRMEPVTTGS